MVSKFVKLGDKNRKYKVIRLYSEAVAQRYSVRKVFLEIS